MTSSWWQRFRLKAIVNCYLPYVGAGIRLTHISPDFSVIEARLGLYFWNRNYVGTQFGGSLYSLADPFFMIMLMQQLGPAFIVWDKEATIRFRRPGRSAVRARFEMPPARVEEIRQAALQQDKVEPTFFVDLMGADGQRVAQVEKLLYVRRKGAQES